MAMSHQLIVVAALAVMLIGTEATCPGGQQNCNGKCVDTKNDISNCGNCNNKCQIGVNIAQCNNGLCQYCPPTSPKYCDTNGGYGRCSNLNTDVNDCGKCNNKCQGQDAMCVMGVCTKVCQGGKQYCNNQCVDTRNDVNNCGGCGNKCQDQNAKCEMGVCKNVCQGQYCNNQCVDTKNDVNNCGWCGNKCQGPNPRCTFGSCRPPCPWEQQYCNNQCVDTKNDVNNCGWCGNKCQQPYGGRAVCRYGNCKKQCPNGMWYDWRQNRCV